ncbi:MAG: hypothetical protein ACE5PV_22325 [Candidatus Poribacteria bacterium]
MRRQTQMEHHDSTGEKMYHKPITTRVKNGVIEIPQPFLQHIPEEGQCDIEMVSDNVMVIVFKERDGFDTPSGDFDTLPSVTTQSKPQPKDCFAQLKGIEHLLELYEENLLDAENKAALLTQLQQEIQELWKLAVGKGKYFEQCVIMMKVAIRRIAPKSFNLTHLNLFLDMIRRLQKNQVTKEDVQKYDKLLAAKGMDVMLELGQDIAQSYLKER